MNHRRYDNYPNDEIKTKLNTAFQVLRVSYGYLAKQSFLCCGSCAWSEAASMIAAHPGKYRGVVFYHKQDADDLKARKDPGCYLAFGSVGMSNEADGSAAEAIGQRDRDVARCLGLGADVGSVLLSDADEVAGGRLGHRVLLSSSW